MLKVSNLHVEIDGNEVLKGLDIQVQPGEVHAIMGPNGSGKSTLSKVLAGHPGYEVTKGSVSYEVNFKEKNLLELEPDERAKEGIFLAFQYPTEIPGVTNLSFLRTAFNSICKYQGIQEMEEGPFEAFAKEKCKIVDMNPDYLYRAVNEGFSGGEKKRNEIVQMAVLNPRLSVLDETDSGLDIDSLKIVAEGVNKLKSSENAVILITHYQRLLDYIEPDFVHVLQDGKIVKSGDKGLAKKLEAQGYEWVTEAGAQA